MWPKPLQRSGAFRKLGLMGLLYAGACLAAEFVAILPFAADVAEGLNVASTTQDLAPLLLSLRNPMMLFLALYLPLGAAFWYAPVLMIWHGLRLTQALFFSLVACWRNKWAFLVYGSAWAMIFLFIDLGAGLLVTAGLPPSMVSAVQIPVSIAAGGMLYCSFYPSYTSVFGIDGASPSLDHRNGAQA
jgi:hypothetical protein